MILTQSTTQSKITDKMNFEILFRAALNYDYGEKYFEAWTIENGI